jgi:hypothetical protein
MDLSNEATRKELAARPREEIVELLAKLQANELIEAARGVVAGLGVYEVKMTKEERVGSKVLPPQTIRVTMRESPHAARLEFIDGPSKGRKVLYNEELKKNEMRVKEGGALGLVGALWISFDNPLARGDTRHPPSHIGYGRLLGMFEKDLKAAEPYGGFSRKDLGFDAKGMWSVEFTAPPGAKGLEADRAKLTMDLMVGLPLQIETHDDKGMLERHRYELVKKQISVGSDFFQPKAFGL